MADALAERAQRHVKDEAAEAGGAADQGARPVEDLLDAWEKLAKRQARWAVEAPVPARGVGAAPPLLVDPLDPELAKRAADAEVPGAPLLRDVEPR